VKNKLSKNNLSEEIQTWLRPIQRSLTLEAESNFQNIFGREKFFSDYIFRALVLPEFITLQVEDTNKLLSIRNKFHEYSNITITERKSIVIQTRKILFKISREYAYINQNNKSKLINHNNKSLTSKKLPNYKLSDDLIKIEGIGPKTIEKFESLGIFKIRDLLFYFPKDYIDYSCKSPIYKLSPNNTYTCIGYIKRAYFYKSKSNQNISILSILLSDKTGVIKITKFYIGSKFSSFSFRKSILNIYTKGIKIAVCGQVKHSEYGKSFVEPRIHILNDNYKSNINSIASFLPVYKLVEGLSNDKLIEIVSKILPIARLVPETLTSEQLTRNNLIDRSIALQNIHKPSDQELLSKARERLVFDEFYLLQLRLLIKKNKYRNFNSPVYTSRLMFKDVLPEFIRSLPFNLTNSQEHVLEEILIDLSNPYPMSRLLQGDVGSGKTIVAFAALFKCLELGWQGALMAPTEVLAEQHYEKLIIYANQFLINVEILTGSTSRKDKKRILNELINGEIDILIGTHSLIEDNVQFLNLGLIVIDEQHRFGVNQRNKLLIKGSKPHLLSMTATPIPRSLTLTIYGDLDVSKITEMPPNRKPVKTEIILQEDINHIYEKIRYQINRGFQAYIIFPLIEESKSLDLESVLKNYNILSSQTFSEFDVGLLHGKMNSTDKNKVISDFKFNKNQILVSTTVVEVGVDVPNANLMLIFNSERFGISQLHQLRGRVGRGTEQSFCYLITPSKSNKNLPRLKSLESSNDGFEIAEKDLEIRGPGQIYGLKQSGSAEFLLANLFKDKYLLESARNEAILYLQEENYQIKNTFLNSILIEKDDINNNNFYHTFLN
tara:strand:- start:19069 stop:21570 length:2502 start_codon:yes stop_codon:yes gene_type:complete